jgi:outer membrane protein OmpA-like peptidoglycan-associated protein
MEGELFVGGFLSNSLHQFYDLPKVGMATRPDLATFAPTFGLRYGVFFNDFLGLEADGSTTLETTQVGGASVKIFHFGGTVLGQLPLAERKVIPFVGLGGGVWDSHSSALGNAVHAPLHGELGVRVFVTDTLALRADARLYRGPSYKDPYTLAASYGELAIGVSWIPHLPASKHTVEHVDGDRDGDGIPDAKDACPDEPEDKDLFQDEDGCPDLDNDGDGIPDTVDKCPNDPETINGVQDDDGCPDKGDALVMLSPERLELLESIQFDGAKLGKKTGGLLGQIGATLRAHGEIARLRITVHVQPTTSPDKDQDLSDKRAAAIRDWLVQWGVDQKRLVPRGFGGTKPLVAPDQKGAAALNDRVELIILERK